MYSFIPKYEVVSTFHLRGKSQRKGLVEGGVLRALSLSLYIYIYIYIYIIIIIFEASTLV